MNGRNKISKAVRFDFDEENRYRLIKIFEFKI